MPPDPPPLKTPTFHRAIFRAQRGSPALISEEDGSVWERDRAEHGGPQWKRWSDQRAWEQREQPLSVWPDGRVRK